MSGWKIESDENYLKILDSKGQTAGYLDLDLGADPNEMTGEEFERHEKNRTIISKGYLTFPMVKFGIFDPNYEAEIEGLEEQIRGVQARISRWKDFLRTRSLRFHHIRTSHTDHDMLSITIPIIFGEGVPFHRNILLDQIKDLLDDLQGEGIL